MKGYTTIELFDGLTGKLKEKVEDHNMQTNGIDKIAKFALRHSYGYNGIQNLYTSHLHLLSGVCLFDSVITENANTIWLPAGVKPTAYAYVDSSNNSDSAKQLGTYDTTESDTSQPFVKKWVWNWAPTQGNGTIKSVCLTHYNAGCFGFGDNQQGASCNVNFGYKSKYAVLSTIVPQPKDLSKAQAAKGYYDNKSYQSTIGGEYLDFCIDADNDEKWMFRVNASSLSVIKHKMSFTHFDVFQSSINLQEYTEETYAGTYTGSYFKGIYNSDEKILYFWTDGGQDYYSGTSSLTIYKYDIVNKTVSTHGTFSWTDKSFSYMMVTNSAVYYMTNNTYKPLAYKYAFATGNTTLCTGQVDINQGSSQAIRPNKSYILNGIITFEQPVGYFSKQPDVLIDTSDDSVRYSYLSTYGTLTSSSSSGGGICPVIPPYDSTQVAFGGGALYNQYFQGSSDLSTYINLEQSSAYGQTTYIPVNYLGTINNLPTTITKNATQSMKLTYTIEKEE